MEISRVAHNAFLYAQAQTQTAQTHAAAHTAELSQQQIDLKTQSALIKNDNDLFGALKTLERANGVLSGIAKAAQKGEIDIKTASESIANKINLTNYKNENLYANFPLIDSSTIDISDRVKLDENGDINSYIKTLDAVIKETSEALASVKTRILSGTQKMGESAQASYEKSGLNTVNPANIFATTNAEYLKEQFGKLMR